jgi:hypothetical protein
MSGTPLQIYRGIRDRLREIDGLNAYDFVPGASEWPGAFVLLPIIEHEGLADDWVTLRFDIVVLVSATIDENQLTLLEYQGETGDKSIHQAFASEPTLGGLCGDVRVARSRPLGYEEQAGYAGFGAVFETMVRI